uniref:CUB domain-containing protein n=1 Tax=Glossina morsitans morsitans TaxID=37546 RepID=A0A1B0G9K9_GLOMM
MTRKVFLNHLLGISLALLFCKTPKAAPSFPISDNSLAINLNHATWPALKHYDIWNDYTQNEEHQEISKLKSLKTLKHNNRPQDEEEEEVAIEYVDNNEQIHLNNWNVNEEETEKPIDLINFQLNHSLTEPNNVETKSRNSKVIHLFPVPVDGECLSNDGRRSGTCFNAYECRSKGGIAKGECAMGFGVCCICERKFEYESEAILSNYYLVVANCNETITNNMTYLTSPNFPSFMTENFTDCNLRVRLLNNDISQLRIDFYHFTLGQPNRRSGVCDGDVFQVSGGPGGTFSLCGQNSGQHIYYDVGGRIAPRQTLYGTLRPIRYEDFYPNRTASNESIEVDISLKFAQRFLPTRLWDIRIAQISFSQRAPAGCLQYFTGNEGVLQTFNFADNGRHLANQNYRICIRQETDMCSIVYQPCDEQSFRIGLSSPIANGSLVANGSSSSQMGGTISQTIGDNPNFLLMNFTTLINTENNTTTTSDTTTGSSTVSSATTTEMSSTPLRDDVEGSGDDDDAATRFGPTPSGTNVSRRPRPVSGGFDILGLLRTAFDFDWRNRHRRIPPFVPLSNFRRKRQFYSNCRDRLTMPCIIEDFIESGLGPLPGCEPVHCGAQFCSSGIWPCRIESTVTPFYVGIHFGDGAGKGSAEDNIGACLRFQQVQCM